MSKDNYGQRYPVGATGCTGFSNPEEARAWKVASVRAGFHGAAAAGQRDLTISMDYLDAIFTTMDELYVRSRD